MLSFKDENNAALEVDSNDSDKMIPRLCRLITCIASLLSTFKFAILQGSRVGFVLNSSLNNIQMVLGSELIMLLTEISQCNRVLAISATCTNLESVSTSTVAASHLR
jgi:hypothetical protein